MFISTVRHRKKGVEGFYCTLVESVRDSSGEPRHRKVRALGFVAAERLPFLKAAYGEGDPFETLARESGRRLVADNGQEAGVKHVNNQGYEQGKDEHKQGQQGERGS